ncbi:MAG: hypothetical protein HY516_03760, partial [Candidatus Aenigmarchaeota archaeon]|nr:hypothetical protein [Candidatus Aenigmarchaeota archaeon]
PGGAYCSDGDIKVYALNNGDSAITANDVIVAQVDGVDVLNTPFFGDMSPNLAGYWKLDETSGTIATDSSGKNNNGAFEGTSKWVPGKQKNAAQFDLSDGADDIKVNGVPIVTSAGTYNTAQFWMLWKGASGGMPFGWQTAYDLWFSGDTFGFNTGGGDLYGISGANAKLANRWAHVTAIFPNSYPTDEPALYIDGVKQSLSLLQGTRNARSAATPVFISGWGAGIVNMFTGTVDEVKVYTSVIGSVNIQPGKSGPIISYPGAEGKHIIRIGTSTNVAETSVTC